MAWESNSAVVVPIDFSGFSVVAVRKALQIASSPELVHVVHVVVALDHIAPGSLGISLPTDEDRRAAVNSHFASYLKESGISGVRQVILDGRPGEVVADYAKSVHAELIVIPSHGYHGMKRLLLGSVAEQVVRLAECPVLVLRRQDAE